MAPYASIARIHVVVPGLTALRWMCGGLLIARKLATLLNEHVPTSLVTSVDRDENVPHLDDLLPEVGDDDVFVITWGPHVTELLARLVGRRIIYYAQSTGWGLHVPVTVPIVCLSRYIMAWWMREAPNNALFVLGPVVEPDCVDRGLTRDIDVLFLERKSSPYLTDRLVPALRDRVAVHTVREFIPRGELFRLYNRSRVYVYSSNPWRSGWVEGLGFQPLEALLCGCTVFSNLHGGLSDYLEPEMNAFKLAVHSLAYDVRRILRAVESGPPHLAGELERLGADYSETSFHRRASRILAAVDELFGHMDRVRADIGAPGNRAAGAWTKILVRAQSAWRDQSALGRSTRS